MLLFAGGSTPLVLGYFVRHLPEVDDLEWPASLQSAKSVATGGHGNRSRLRSGKLGTALAMRCAGRYNIFRESKQAEGKHKQQALHQCSATGIARGL